MLRGLAVGLLVCVFSLSSPAWAVDDGVAAFYAGHKALDEGSVNEAIGHFSKAIKSGTLDQIQTAYVYHYRAVAYQKLEKQKEAIDDYSQALAIGSLPKRVQAAVYYNRGIGLDRQGKLQDAVKDYSAAIALKNDYAEAYMNRGNANRKLGNKVQALKDYEASSKYGNPLKHLPYFGRGLVLEDLGDTDAAYDAFKIAASLAPADFSFAAQKVADYDAGQIPTSGGLAAAPTGEAGTQVAAAARPEGITAATKPASKANAASDKSKKPAPNEQAKAETEKSVASVDTNKPVAKQPTKQPNSSSAAKAKPSEAEKAARAKAKTATAKTASAKATQANQTAKPVSAKTPSAPTAVADKQPAKPKAAAKPAKTAGVALTGFVVQVASYGSEAAALTESAQLQRRNADMFGAVQEQIVRADLGAKGVYWRLQYGPFDSRASSNGFCAKLKTRGHDCIIVSPKKKT